MNFSCPTCTQVMQCPDEFAGRKAVCPKCGQKILIPTPPPPLPTASNKTTLGKLEENVSQSPVSIPVPVPQPPPPPLLPTAQFADDGEPDSQAASSKAGAIAENLPAILLVILAKDWRRLLTCLHLWLGFLFFFLPWINISCDGRPMASQSGLQTCYGGVTLDQKLERMAKAGGEQNAPNQPAIGKDDDAAWSLLSILYITCIVAGGLLGFACIVAVFLKLSRAGAATHLLSLGFGSLAFMLLAAQMTFGFPYERRMDAAIEKLRRDELKRQADQAKLGMPRDVFGNLGAVLGAGMIEVRYSFWLWFSVVIASLSIPAFVLEFTISGYQFLKANPIPQSDTG
jgi:hypothetical protein